MTTPALSALAALEARYDGGIRQADAVLDRVLADLHEWFERACETPSRCSSPAAPSTSGSTAAS
ncbi:MAG: hypothetical protein V5A61_08370 [Haloarculaceae archaeon]